MKTFFIIFLLSLSVLAFSPKVETARAATDYSLLAPLPLTQSSDASNTDQSTTPEQYIIGIVNLAVAAAGVIAVLKLMIAGFKYIYDDSFSGKDTARNDINNAVIGLILAIGAFTILRTISTQFTSLTISVDTVGTSKNLENGGVCVNGGTFVAGKCVVTDPSTADAVKAGCINGCVPVDTFKFDKKPPDSGCAGTTCFVNQILGEKLDTLKEATDKLDPKVKWQVTEMFPPKGTHTSGCHAVGALAGTCVDASLDSTTRSPAQIAKFLENIAAYVSPSFQYELQTSAECSALKNDPALKIYKNYFVWNSKLQGGAHVHINLSGPVKVDESCTMDTSQEN